jgi:hypothetical protein
MTNKELNDLFAKLATSQEKTEAQLAKTMATVEKVSKQIGGMGRNQGDVAEEFFYNSLLSKPVVGTVHFDHVSPNVIVGSKKKQSEFDIVLTNGSSVAIVEVKYKVHASDLDQVEAQMKRYREIYPAYKNHKLYGGIAGFSVPPEVVKSAHERGLFVLKRKGDAYAVDAKEMRAF